jgi:hypothetical protein
LNLLNAEERRLCAELAAFPEDLEIALAVLQDFWGLDEFETEDLAQKLHARSLIHLNLHSRSISIHPVIRGYLRQIVGDMSAVENRASDTVKRQRA